MQLGGPMHTSDICQFSRTILDHRSVHPNASASTARLPSRDFPLIALRAVIGHSGLELIAGLPERYNDKKERFDGDHGFPVHLSAAQPVLCPRAAGLDRKSTRLNSSHLVISYA